MKEESVLNVLMYLFQNHMKDSCELEQDPNIIINALEAAGFESSLINEALTWLETLVKEDTKLFNSPKPLSTRVYTTEEYDALDRECLSFLVSLEQQRILTPETREIVINQALALEFDDVDVSLLKWVTLMVLFNHPNTDNALARMEFLVLDNTPGGVH